jgi:hypothetical protein
LNLLISEKSVELDVDSFSWYEKYPLHIQKDDVVRLKELYSSSLLSSNSYIYKLFIQREIKFYDILLSILKNNIFSDIYIE